MQKLQNIDSELQLLAPAPRSLPAVRSAMGASKMVIENAALQPRNRRSGRLKQLAVNILPLSFSLYFLACFAFFLFFISQSKFGRRHGKLFGWKIIHETWRQHANATAAATVTAKRECERELEIFVPNPNLIVTQTNCSGCRRCRLSLSATRYPHPSCRLLFATCCCFCCCFRCWSLVLRSMFGLVWFGVSHIYVPIFSM